jgi:hypothetical protein
VRHAFFEPPLRAEYRTKVLVGLGNRLLQAQGVSQVRFRFRIPPLRGEQDAVVQPRPWDCPAVSPPCPARFASPQ